MKDTIINELSCIFSQYLKEKKIEDTIFVVEKTKNIEWGDYSTNIALVLSKKLSKNPMIIAEEIAKDIKSSKIMSVNVTKPGFINIFLSNTYYNDLLKDVNVLGKEYGQFDKKNIFYNIEYVSANPTGSLHIGHSRNAALGDTLANVWEKFGIDVDREYYINDGGGQINKLGVSVLIRYMQLFNKKVELPEDAYRGEEPKWVAAELKKIYNDKFLNVKFDDTKILDEEAREAINDYAKIFLFDKIKDTLSRFRAKFDIYYPESQIMKDNLIDKSLDKLKPFTFEKDGALWLKTTDFKDDKDRVLIKSDKEYTYFLPDLCYHNVKLSRRNYKKIFNIFGADHGSYVVRLKAACECFGYKDTLEVVVMQMVKLIKDKQPFKMSKRTGNSLTLNDLIESIGVDSARWYLVSQSANAHLEIDVDKVKQKDNSNSLFYVMYANARIAQILANYNMPTNFKIDSTYLKSKTERELLNLICYYPCVIELISKHYEVHALNVFLIKIASIFHTYYSEERIINDDPELTFQRIILIKAIKSIIVSGLKLMEIDAVDKFSY